MKSTLPQPNPSPQSSCDDAEKWFCIAEYGNWPHDKGLQCFGLKSARCIVKSFKSLRQRLARRFGGIPIYIGHPDDASFAQSKGHQDTRAYGWIKDLEARSDGLYGLAKWSNAGKNLLNNAFYKFVSPRWGLEPIDQNSFEPTRLISIGLTNQPNIPGRAIANAAGIAAAAQIAKDAKPEDASAADEPVSDIEPAAALTATQLLEALQLGHAANPLGAANTLMERAKLWECEGQRLKTEKAELAEESERFYKIATEKQKDFEALQKDFELERESRVELIVENALLKGSISPCEAERWTKGLNSDIETGLSEISALNCLLKTKSTTENLSNAQAQDNGFLQKVHRHCEANKSDFTQSWLHIKRKNPEQYQAFLQCSI